MNLALKKINLFLMKLSFFFHILTSETKLEVIKMKKISFILIVISLLALLMIGCQQAGQAADGEGSLTPAMLDENGLLVSENLLKVQVSAAPQGPTAEPIGAAQNALIGLDAAKQIALDHCKLGVSDVVFTKAKQSKEDGVVVYDIEFYAQEIEYDYEIDATTGAIREYDYDTHRPSNGDGSIVVNPTSVPSQDEYIGLEAAKLIALNHAELSENEVIFTEAKRSRDDGVVVYDIEFYAQQVEYDYEIDAITGAIREWDRDTHNSSGSGSNNEPKPTTAPTQNEHIGLDAAKKIALNHAGVSASQVTFTKAKQDKDDGRVVYEIEFFVGNVEYEYEIDAITGKIREWDREVDDD